MSRWIIGCALALACATPTTRAAAQYSVTGQIAITERPGEQTEDLGNAAVWLEPLGGSAPHAPVTRVPIAMQGRRFIPSVRLVGAGSTIEFPNQDPFSHNVFSRQQPGAFDMGNYPRGKSRAQKMEDAGVYPVYCNIHPRMTAWVLVLRTPWMAQAEGDGRFTIPNVPAGRYTMHVWHNRAPEQVRTIDVSAGTAPLRIELDARGWRYVQHKNKLGQDYVSGGERY